MPGYLAFEKNSAPLLSQIKKKLLNPADHQSRRCNLRSSIKLRSGFLMKPVRLPIFTKMLLCHKNRSAFHPRDEKSRCGSFKIHSGFRYNFLNIFGCFEIYLFRQKE